MAFNKFCMFPVLKPRSHPYQAELLFLPGMAFPNIYLNCENSVVSLAWTARNLGVRLDDQLSSIHSQLLQIYPPTAGGYARSSARRPWLTDNTAGGLVFNISRFAHTTPLLCTLYISVLNHVCLSCEDY